MAKEIVSAAPANTFNGPAKITRAANTAATIVRPSHVSFHLSPERLLSAKDNTPIATDIAIMPRPAVIICFDIEATTPNATIRDTNAATEPSSVVGSLMVAKILSGILRSIIADDNIIKLEANLSNGAFFDNCAILTNPYKTASKETTPAPSEVSLTFARDAIAPAKTDIANENKSTLAANAGVKFLAYFDNRTAPVVKAITAAASPTRDETIEETPFICDRFPMAFATIEIAEASSTIASAVDIPKLEAYLDSKIDDTINPAIIPAKTPSAATTFEIASAFDARSRSLRYVNARIKITSAAEKANIDSVIRANLPPRMNNSKADPISESQTENACLNLVTTVWLAESFLSTSQTALYKYLTSCTTTKIPAIATAI